MQKLMLDDLYIMALNPYPCQSLEEYKKYFFSKVVVKKSEKFIVLGIL